jgi:hypothetical protein
MWARMNLTIKQLWPVSGFLPRILWSDLRKHECSGRDSNGVHPESKSSCYFLSHIFFLRSAFQLHRDHFMLYSLNSGGRTLLYALHQSHRRRKGGMNVQKWRNTVFSEWRSIKYSIHYQIWNRPWVPAPRHRFNSLIKDMKILLNNFTTWNKFTLKLTFI